MSDKVAEVEESAVASPVPVNVVPEKKNDPDEEKTSKSVYGGLVHSVVTVLSGIGLIGSTVPILADLEGYNSIRSPLSEAGSPLAFDIGLPFMVLGGGFIIILAGGLDTFGWHSKSRNIVYGGMLLSLVGAVLTFFACIQITATLDSMFERLQSNPVSDPNFEAKDKSVMDFTAAIFNECCIPVYDSNAYNFGDLTDFPLTRPAPNEGELADTNQRAVGPCLGTLQETCPLASDGAENPMFPEIVDEVLGVVDANGQFGELLCHCISSQTEFNKYVEIFRRDGTCETFRTLVVDDADDRTLPLGSIDLAFKTLVAGLITIRPEFSGKSLPINEFAVVGKMLPKVSIYGEAAEDIGFSCGLGYSKGLALVMYFYITDRVDILVAGGFACAGISIASSLLTLLFWFTGGGSSDDEEEYGEPDGHVAHYTKPLENDGYEYGA